MLENFGWGRTGLRTGSRSAAGGTPMLTKSRLVALATAVVTLVVLAFFAWRDGPITQASPGGLLNPGFEDGTLDGLPKDWNPLLPVPDAKSVIVVDSEGPGEFPAYADMGGGTVSPYKGSLMLRLGVPKRVAESQNRGTYGVSSKTFISDRSTLKFAMRLFSWEHRVYDRIEFDLKNAATGASVGKLASDLVVNMPDGSMRGCSDAAAGGPALPCGFNIDVGKRGQFLDTVW